MGEHALGTAYSLDAATLIAIPLFVFMGIMLQRSRIAEDLLITMAGGHAMQNYRRELDLERVVQMVTDAGVELSGAQVGAFFYNVTDADGESYMLFTVSGVERSAFDRFPMPRKTAVFAPTFDGAGVVRSDDITQDPRYGKSDTHHGMPKQHLPVRSYLAVPVISRSGEVIGGLLFGLSRKAAAEFSFFLAIPTMFAAVLYDLYRNRSVLQADDWSLFVVGFSASFVSAFFAVRALLRYIARHDYSLFAWYRIVFGVIVLYTAYSGLVTWP